MIPASAVNADGSTVADGVVHGEQIAAVGRRLADSAMADCVGSANDASGKLS